MSNLNLFIPITKVDAAKRLVYGTLTEEVPDKAGEIIDYESTKKAYQAWSDEISVASGGKSKGNLRAMHGNVAAGKFNEIVFDDAAKKIQGVAYVADDNEWKKVEEGIYTGFSHGGSYASRWKDPENPALTRYTPKLAEVSLVDNPCVPTATFEFIKEDGSAELRKFNTSGAQEAQDTMTKTQDTKTTDATPNADTTTDDTLAKDAATAEEERPQDKGGVVQGFQAKDGSFHLKKADALKRNSEVDAEAAVAAVAAPALAALDKLDEALTKAEGPAKEEPMEKAAEGDADSKDGKTDEKPADEKKEGEEDVQKAATSDENPTGEADKASGTEKMKKGMYSVSTFAELLQSIQYLQQDTQWEAEWEGDNSELPAKLKAWLAEGGTLLTAMAAEEAAELTAEKAAGGDLAKAGARNSKSDATRIQKVHDTSVELGAACDSVEKAAGGDMAKVAAENAALSKIIGDLTPKLETLIKRVENLESQPMPAKGVVRVVEKSADTTGSSSGGDPVQKITEHLAGMTPEQQSMTLMKAALANPVAMTA